MLIRLNSSILVFMDLTRFVLYIPSRNVYEESTLKLMLDTLSADKHHNNNAENDCQINSTKTSCGCDEQSAYLLLGHLILHVTKVLFRGDD